MNVFSVEVPILFAVAFVCALIAMGQLLLAMAGKKKYFWALGYFTVSILVAYAALVYSGRLIEYPWMYGLHAVAIFLPGPVFHLYITAWLDIPLSYGKKIHFLPSVLALLFILPFLLSDRNNHTEAIVRYYQAGRLGYVEYIFIAGLCLNIVYAVWVIWQARILYQFVDVHGRSVYLLIALAAGAACVALIIIILAHASSARQLEKVGLFVLCLASILGYFFMQRGAHISNNGLQHILAQHRYRKTQLANIELESLRMQLRQAMEGQKLYRQIDITLPKLAKQLGVRPHQLSEYLNNHEKKSFIAYITEYRINEAKELLVRSDLPAVRIGIEVGFGSKSAFHTAFRRATGLTPKDYRSQNLRGKV